MSSESTEAPSDNQEPWGDDHIERTVTVVARKATNRFHGYVELQDMLQEARLAVITARKLPEWQLEGQPGKDRLFRWLLKSCLLYGQQEKAAKLGYKPADLYFYGMKSFRELIPVVLDSWVSNDLYEDVYPDRAMWLDVSSALLSLSESDYQMVCWAFHGEPGEEEGYELVSRNLGISIDAARQRVGRILRKMQDSLGGENPSPKRARKSNAQAQAETRNAWDGDS